MYKRQFHDTFRAYLPFEVAHAEWRMAHNSYLENVYELGVPGACLLYGLLLGVMARLIRAIRHRRHDCALPAFALASMVTCGLHAGVDFSMQMPALAALLVAIMSIGWAQSFGRKDRRFPEPSL